METQNVTQDATESHSMEDDHIAHLAGVFDIAGIITVHISKDSDYAVGYNLQPLCRISHPIDDDDPLMGKIVAYCDEEDIAYSLTEASHGEGREGKSHRLEIKRPEDIRNFLEPMMPYLVSNYEQAVIMLEEILPRIEESHHREEQGFYELMAYADAIRSTSRHGSRMKYTQEYFADEFSIAE